MALRTRVDVWSISLGTLADARAKPWHPVLDTYARGVTAMKALDPQVERRSWRYVANTHGIDQLTPPRPGIWGQCAHAQRLFLPWHRAYLAWLESLIREATGQPDWALPYWDYSRPTPSRVRTVPPEFRVRTRRVGNADVPNPLFVGERATSVPVGDVEVVPALGERRFVRVGQAGSFSPPGFGGSDQNGVFGLAEMEPHNLVHSDLGGLMGSTRTAGRDPIFWLHHANIDRLWEVWRSLPGSIEVVNDAQLPAAIRSEWTSASFVFGEGNRRARYRMSDCENIAIAPMEYRYDSLSLAPAVLAAVTAARTSVTPGAPMGIDDAEEEVFEPVAAMADVASGDSVDLAFDQVPLGLAAAAPRSLYLEMAAVQGVNPHAVYVVEVSAGPGQPAYRAGRFSTFGLADVDDGDEPTYVINATDVIPDLLTDGWAGGQLTVRVVPDPDRAGADDPGRSVQVGQLTIFVSR